MNDRIETSTLWASVVVLDASRRMRQRHRVMRSDDRGVVSIEYVLIAAAAAAIAFALGTLIWQAVNDAAGNIKTDVVDPGV